MAEVTVPLRIAQTGGLPPVCAMTGAPADGAVPLRVDRSPTRWRSPKVRIPLSDASFRSWRRRQSAMVKTRFAAIALVVVALGFSAKAAFIALTALVLSGLVMALSLKFERSVAEHQPGLRQTRAGLTLTGVHPEFVAAVEASAGARPD